MERATPLAVRLKLPDNVLEIDWSDGVASRYAGAYLRFVCPCAGCRGHGPGQVPEPTWAQVKDVRMLGAEAVGGYALRLKLSDCHESGIYSWDFLRDNDPEPKAKADTGSSA